jgi:hypothetical protein
MDMRVRAAAAAEPAVASAHLHCRMLSFAHGVQRVEIASDAIKALTALYCRSGRIHIFCACGGLGILQRVLEAHAHADPLVHHAMNCGVEVIRKRVEALKF